jgi:ferritin-like metal-binding protein YciE
MLAENVSDLFQRSLEFAYDGENHLVKELPKMADAALSPDLKRALTQHLGETKVHVERLERVFSLLNRAAAEETNHAIRSLTSEGEKLIKHIDRSALLDTALIATGTQVEHHEIALYGSMHQLANVLGFSEAGDLLGKTLEEEKEANQKLTEIGLAGVNRQAMGFQNTPKGIVVI